MHRAAAKDLQEAATTCDPRTPPTDSVSDVARLREALSELPAEQRAILSLHYLDGMPVAEIARVLDVPTGTVKSRLYYARDRLKRTLERNEP